MNIPYNPFFDSGINNYEQYKKYPFLLFGTMELVQNRINQQIKQIKNKYFFGERLILIGERGIGKTSGLFFVNDMLEDAEINSKFFTRLFEDAEHYNILTGNSISLESNQPLYLLIDFPDAFNIKQFKNFLGFLDDILRHKNHDKINLIFSMNKSHYEKSFSYSEVFGKFTTLRLERLQQTETYGIIESRCKIIKKKPKELFEYKVMDLVHEYSKGIPRNIISACCLLFDSSNGDKMSKEKAESILKEKYTEQVIEDRISDPEKKRILKEMIEILKVDFNGRTISQQKYVESVNRKVGVGKNYILSRINELIRYGIFTYSRGGRNRLNKIISFS